MAKDSADPQRARRFAGLAVLYGSVMVLAPAQALAAGDRALGEYLAAECLACHQLSGRGTAGIPPIAGWREEQFIAVLDSYGRRQRDNPVMQTVASRLSREEMAALAAYFGSLSPRP